jgi:hypothetical protein
MIPIREENKFFLGVYFPRFWAEKRVFWQVWMFWNCFSRKKKRTKSFVIRVTGIAFDFCLLFIIIYTMKG